MAKLYKCIKCKKEEEPPKFARIKSFLCSSCKKEEIEIEKLYNDNDILKNSEIKNYLLSKGFNISNTGILYKIYNNIRISLSTACSIPMLMVKSKDYSSSFTDSSVLSYIPNEAKKDLKKVINTIDYLWKNQN